MHSRLSHHIRKHAERHKNRIKFYPIFALLVVVFSLALSQIIYLAAATITIGPSSVDPKSIDNTQHKSLQLKTFRLQPTQCVDKSNVVSSEPDILWAVAPGPTQTVGKGGKIKVWYNDEWPISLGQGPNITTNYNGHLVNPDVGDTAARDQHHLPYFPAIFLSDITSNPANLSGEVENGGTPYKPDEIWGAWKPSGKPTDYDASQWNYLKLPQGADPFPSTSNLKTQSSTLFRRPRETSNGTELIWNVDSLNLTAGHTYRVQIILHDGDQYWGGDLGIACTTIQL